MSSMRLGDPQHPLLIRFGLYSASFNGSRSLKEVWVIVDREVVVKYKDTPACNIIPAFMVGFNPTDEWPTMASGKSKRASWEVFVSKDSDKPESGRDHSG